MVMLTRLPSPWNILKRVAYLRRQLLLRQTGLTAFLLQPLRQDKCLRLPVKSLSLIRPGNSKIL